MQLRGNEGLSDGVIRRLDGRDRPAQAVVTYCGRSYRLNLATIERAYVRGVVEGRYEKRDDPAHAIGISRSTLGRFLSGKTTSLRTTRTVLQALGLDFDGVIRPCE